MRPASKSAAPAPPRKAMPPQPKHAPPPPPPAHSVPAPPAAGAPSARGKSTAAATKFPEAPGPGKLAKSPLLHSPRATDASPSFSAAGQKFDFEEDSPPDHSPLSDPEPAEILGEDLASPSPKPGKTAFAKGKTVGAAAGVKKGLAVKPVLEEVPGILKAAAALSPRHAHKKRMSVDSIDSSSDFGVPPPPPPPEMEDDEVVSYPRGTVVSPFTDSSTLVSEFTYNEARFQKPYDLWTTAESEPDKFTREIRAVSSITGHSDIFAKSPKKFVPVPLHSPPHATPISPAVLRSREGSGSSMALDSGLQHLLEKGKLDIEDDDREPLPGGGVKRRSFWDADAEAQTDGLGTSPPGALAPILPAPLLVSPPIPSGEHISPASPRRPIPDFTGRSGTSHSLFSRDASEMGGSTVADLQEAAQAIRSPGYSVFSAEEVDAEGKSGRLAELRKKAALDQERREVLDLGRTFGSTASRATITTMGAEEVSDPKRVKVVYRTKSGPGKGGSVAEPPKDFTRAPVTRTSSSSIGSPDSDAEKHKHLKRLLSRPTEKSAETSTESSDPVVTARPSVTGKSMEEKNAALLSGFKIVKRESRRGTGSGAIGTTGSSIGEGRRGTASGTGDRKLLASAAADLGAIPEKKKVEGSGAIVHRLSRYRTEPIKKKKFSNDLSGSEDESLVPQRGLVAVEDSDPKKKVKKVRAEEPPSP